MPARELPGLIEVESSAQGTTQLVVVRGELDLSTVERVRGRLDIALAEGSETVVLDLSGVTFCDSSGIKLVVESDHRATERRVRFVVIRPAGPAWRPFELCNIDRRVTFIASDEWRLQTPAVLGALSTQT